MAFHSPEGMLHNVSFIFPGGNNLDTIFSNKTGAIWNHFSAFNDTVFNIYVVLNVNFIQNDRIFNHTVISNKYFFGQNGVFNGTIDDTSAGNQTVFHVFEKQDS